MKKNLIVFLLFLQTIKSDDEYDNKEKNFGQERKDSGQEEVFYDAFETQADYKSFKKLQKEELIENISKKNRKI